MNSETRSRPATVTAGSGMADLVDELVRRLQAGESIDPVEVGGGDPARVEQLCRLLPTLEKLAELGGPAAGDDSPGAPAAGHVDPGLGMLGDYRLAREVGRGGMGIVYETVQLSLNRRVAMKVLPFAAVSDPRQLQGSGSRRRPRRSSTTRTSCRSTRWAASGAFTTTPCGSSRATRWAV